MNQPAIDIKNLTQHFGPVCALDNLSLQVPKGIIFGFLGPNGAGKTTTINLLLGLLAPTHGQIRVLGYDTRSEANEVRTHTGALLEHSGVYEQMTVEDNLEFYGRVWGLPRAERQARIQELLSHMGLWARRTDRAGAWSKGMKQKLALARVLLHRPELILLDEPTAGLDVVSAHAVRDDLESLVQNEGTTVFLTTHNMTEAERLCSQVAVIREGKLLAVGHPDELRARARGPRLEIHGRGFSSQVQSNLRLRPEIVDVRVNNGQMIINLNQDIDPAPLISTLVQEGVQVSEVHRGAASLEEVFLTLMEEL